jgi:hypothetical protein
MTTARGGRRIRNGDELVFFDIGAQREHDAHTGVSTNGIAFLIDHPVYSHDSDAGIDSTV